MTNRLKRNLIIFGIGFFAIIGGILGDIYLRDQKPDLFPSIAKTPFTLISHEGKPIKDG